MTAPGDAPAIPDGFDVVDMRGFVGLNGGFLRQQRDDGLRFGFVAETRHCNPFGLVHGGWLSTLADLQLIMEAARASDIPIARLVTASLSVDYLASARLGDWVESRARLLRRTRTLLFVEGTAASGKGDIIRMSGLYQIRDER